MWDIMTMALAIYIQACLSSSTLRMFQISVSQENAGVSSNIFKFQSIMAWKSLKRWSLSLAAESLNTFGGVSSPERTPRTLQITVCQEDRSFPWAWTTLHRPSLVIIPSVVQENAILTWRMTQCPPLEAFSRAFSATVSWPCPKDTLWSFPESIVNPSLLPVRAHNRIRGRVTQER